MAPSFLYLDLCLHVGNISFYTGAQLQFPAQHPQPCGDRANFLGTGRILRQPSVQTIKIGPAVCQSVDLRLQRLLLHGQLLHTVDAVFAKIKELLLVAIKLDDLCP